jgi:hypothetical protein
MEYGYRNLPSWGFQAFMIRGRRSSRKEARRVRIPRGTCGLESNSDVLVDQILAWDSSLFRKEFGIVA